MRRQAIAVAAVACLATAACTTADPAETPVPSTVTTSVAASEPAVSEPESTDAPSGEAETPTAGSSEPVDSAQTPQDVDLADQTFAVTAEQAIGIAQQEAGNGILYSIELDWSQYSDAWVYGIDILTGTTDHEFDINADTGAILDHEQEDTDDQEQEVNLDSPMACDIARGKALDAAPGRITGWELDWEDGHPTFEFEIEDPSGDEVEVEVQADTGAVTIDD